LLASVGLTIAATVAPAEYERVGWIVEGQDYFFNTFHLMYVFAPLAFGLGVFAIWKASHRGGMSWYRRTVRPGLMCLCLFGMGAAVALERTLLAGWAQIIGLTFLGLAAVAFTLLWFLRGPCLVRLPGDAYWNRAWARLFVVVALATGSSGLMLFADWTEEPFATFYREDTETFSTVMTTGRSYYRSDSREIAVANPMYDHQPVAAGLLLLLAIGSLGETRYRVIQGRAEKSKSAGGSE